VLFAHWRARIPRQIGRIAARFPRFALRNGVGGRHYNGGLAADNPSIRPLPYLHMMHF
jgi:hypothetical protein